MGDKTAIEWTDATWNPVTGCTKVSQGCKNCYAERVFPRAYGQQVVPVNDAAGITDRDPDPTRADHFRPRRFTDVKTHFERLYQPLRWKKPRRIFVNSMSDLFHEAVPESFIDQVFAVMAIAQRHAFQVLTKRPERMRKYLSGHEVGARWAIVRGLPSIGEITASIAADWTNNGLPNVHLGVSCEDQITADERIPLLLQTPAAVRFVSLEPLLGPINLRVFLDGADSGCSQKWCNHSFLSWVIVGGESGPNARPMHPDWARSLRDQCVAASVPFFFKQWGEWIPRRFYEEPSKGANYAWGALDIQGNWFTNTTPWNGKQGPDSESHEYAMLRVGKKSAGAMLDGREWKEFPEARGKSNG